MRLKDTVFGSTNERELFTALYSEWSTHFNLWPSLPFLSVIDVDGSEVTSGEWNTLVKTSVDITLCTRADDRPVVSIEFDGLGHGFSREGEYVQMHPSHDPNRKLKLDLKLRIAGRVQYPFFVLSYDEKNAIGPKLTLTIADGIIGQVVAKRRMDELIDEWVAVKPVESVHPALRQDYAQDVVDSAEVQAELELNPIARLAAQYSFVVGSHLGMNRFPRKLPLHDPELPDLDQSADLPFPSLQSLEARIRAMKEAIEVGCRADIDTPKGSFSETVWVRNITGPGVLPMALAQDIAELVVLKQVTEAYGLTEADVMRLSQTPSTRR